MSDDINSPRVRQILAIHAEQAAVAKGEAQTLWARVRYLEAQLAQMFAVAKDAAEQLRGIGQGDGIEQRAREHIDNPGPCSCQTKVLPGKCPVCGEGDRLPF